MPNRIVRDGILTSERVDELDAFAERFYRRLMSVVDDFGRYFANEKLLRAAIFPLKIDSISNEQIQSWIIACQRARLLMVCTIDNKAYLEIVDFNQQIRTQKSKFPSLYDKCQSDDKQLISDAKQMISDDTQMRSTCIADDTHTLSKNEQNELETATGLDLSKNAKQMISDDTQLISNAHLDVVEDVVVVEDGVSFTKTKNRFCFGNTQQARVKLKTECNQSNNPNTHAAPTLAGEICLALKNLGLSDINPLHPELRWLIDQGVPQSAFEEAATMAKLKGKGFAYTLGIVKSQIGEAKKAPAIGKWLNPFKPNNPHDQHAVVEPI